MTTTRSEARPVRTVKRLNWINTRILLGVIFYGLITPMGIVMRLFGRGQMDLARADNLDTYRVIRKPRSKDHMNHQF